MTLAQEVLTQFNSDTPLLESFDEAADGTAIIQALLKKFGNDPYYNDVIQALAAKDGRKVEKAKKALATVRGHGAVDILGKELAMLAKK